MIIHGYAVKTLESKETRASKRITVTHNSVFAAHRLQCRMTNRKNRHPAFCFSFCHSARSRGTSNFATGLFAFVLQARNMSRSKLPTAIALDHCVSELHDSVERLAVRCSFHTRFSENDGYAIAVKPR